MTPQRVRRASCCGADPRLPGRGARVDPRLIACVWIISCGHALGPPAAVQAQPASTDPTGIYRLRPPEWPVAPPARFELRIETPEKSPVPRAVDELRFELKRIAVVGVSRYPADEIDRLFAGLVGSRVGLAEIRAAAEQLEQRYRDDGYFLVRVLIPAQRIIDGTIQIQVIEGQLSAAFAQGGTARLRERIERMTEPLLERRPLDLASLESVILRINDLPGIDGQAVLRPGTELGQSELIFNVTPTPAPRLGVEINNHSSRPLGEYGFNISGSYANPLGTTGSLDLGLNASADAEKLRAFSARYATPFGHLGSVFSLGTLLAHARPAGSLRDLGLISDSRSISPRLRVPLIRSRGLSVFAEFGFTFTDALTSLDELQLSHDRYAVAERSLIITDAQRWAGSTEVRIGYSAGLTLKGFDAPAGSQPSIADAEPRFHKLHVTARRHQQLSPRYSLQLVLRSQSTDDVLLSGEKIAFGGPALGRAYDGGTIAGDRGWGALAELRWTPEGGFLRRHVDAGLQVYGFGDYARARDMTTADNQQSGPRRGEIRSMGLGTRLMHASGLQVELQIAKALVQIASSDPRPDPRVSVSISQNF